MLKIRSKKVRFGFDIVKAISFFVLLFFHNQLTNLLISLTGHDVETSPDIIATDLFLRYHNAVVYGTIGVGLFFLLSSTEYFFFLNSKQNSSQLLKYCRLLNRMIQWLVFFVFCDIVLQNIYNQNTTLSNFVMRYQAIGGLLAVELLIIRYFWVTNKNR